MKKLTLILLLISCTAFAQEKFTISKGEGFTDYIVYEVPSLSAEELKSKTLEFIESKRQTENDAIIKQSENSVTFNHFVPGGISYEMGYGMNMSYDVEVLVEVSFKDGRYKYVLINAYWSKNAEKKAFTSAEMDNMFRSNGKLKKHGEGFIHGLENSVNGFAIELYNHLNGKTTTKSDW